MKSNNLINVLILALLICNSSRSQPIKIELDPVNPTSYDFHSSVKEVHDAIKKGLDSYTFKNALKKENYYTNLNLIWLDNKYKLIHAESQKILSKPGNTNDAILESLGYTAPSTVYYSKDGNKQLDFISNFHIHLIPINDSITRVVIIPMGFKVIVGVRLLPRPGICGFYRPDIIKTPPSTTVEEYELLLKIGEILGEKKMPLMVNPKKQIILKSKSYN